MLKNKKILITGINGFIGSSLQKNFKKKMMFTAYQEKKNQKLLMKK